MKLGSERGGSLTRLAICVLLSAAAIRAAEAFFEGKHQPLWEQYGPWILENRITAVSIGAAALYAASLALFPPEEDGEEDGYVPC